MTDKIIEIVLQDTADLASLAAASSVPVFVWDTGAEEANNASRAEEIVLGFANSGAPFVLAVTGNGSVGRTVVDAAPLCFAESAVEIVNDGVSYSAEALARQGVINGAEADPDEVLSKARRVAAEISQVAPLAVRAVLEAVRKGGGGDLESGLSAELDIFCGLFATGDMREGTRAFLEKRTPVFRGE